MPKKPKAKKVKKLTVRQRELIKNIGRGMSVSRAAVRAGYTDKAPRQAGHQALEQIKRSMPELLDAKGLTDDALIDNYLRPGLEAKEVRLSQFMGQFTDHMEVIDHGVRRDYLDMTFKLKGSYAPTKQSIAAENGPLMVQIVTNFTFPDAKLRDA